MLDMIQSNIGSVVNAEKLEFGRVDCVLANYPKTNQCISLVKVLVCLMHTPRDPRIGDRCLSNPLLDTNLNSLVLDIVCQGQLCEISPESAKVSWISCRQTRKYNSYVCGTVKSYFLRSEKFKGGWKNLRKVGY